MDAVTGSSLQNNSRQRKSRKKGGGKKKKKAETFKQTGQNSLTAYAKLAHEKSSDTVRIQQGPDGAAYSSTHESMPGSTPSCPEQSPSTNEEKLHPAYKVQEREDFRVGSYISVWWAEPAGQNSVENPIHNSGLVRGKLGEMVFHKARRFIMIAVMDNHCIAIPICSYGQRGMAKSSVRPDVHANVYTELRCADEGENGLLPEAIRVDRQMDGTTDSELKKFSRLNFEKLYTIEYNVKIRTLGNVNSDSMRALGHQFFSVWEPSFNQLKAISSQLEPTASSMEAIEQATSKESGSGPHPEYGWIPIHKVILGTPGEEEECDSRFKRQDHPLDFFVPGKFFTKLPGEERNPGDEGYEDSMITDEFVGISADGEMLTLPSRGFIVVRAGRTSSLCLSVISHNGKGVPPGYDKTLYSIVHVGKHARAPEPWEMPTPEDQSELRDSIRVRRDDRATTLKPLSRLFYGKVYEVMHDVKVHSFGYVSNSSQQVLKREFEASLGCQALNFTGMTNVVEELDDEMDYSEAMLFQMGGTDSSESEGRSVDSSDEEWPDGYVGGDLLSETNTPLRVFQNGAVVVLLAKDKNTMELRLKRTRVVKAKFDQDAGRWEYKLRYYHGGKLAGRKWFGEEHLARENSQVCA